MPSLGKLLVYLNRYPAVTAKWLRRTFAEPVTALRLCGTVARQSNPYFYLPLGGKQTLGDHGIAIVER